MRRRGSGNRPEVREKGRQTRIYRKEREGNRRTEKQVTLEERQTNNDNFEY